MSDSALEFAVDGSLLGKLFRSPPLYNLFCES